MIDHDVNISQYKLIRTSKVMLLIIYSLQVEKVYMKLRKNQFIFI